MTPDGYVAATLSRISAPAGTQGPGSQHRVEGSHSDRFAKLMDHLRPDWRRRRDLLNASPLAHAEWPRR